MRGFVKFQNETGRMYRDRGMDACVVISRVLNVNSSLGVSIAPAEAGAMASPAKANALTVEASRKFLAQEKLPRAMIEMSDESEEYSIILCERECYSIQL